MFFHTAPQSPTAILTNLYIELTQPLLYRIDLIESPVLRVINYGGNNGIH